MKTQEVEEVGIEEVGKEIRFLIWNGSRTFFGVLEDQTVERFEYMTGSLIWSRAGYFGLCNGKSRDRVGVGEYGGRFDDWFVFPFVEGNSISLIKDGNRIVGFRLPESVREGHENLFRLGMEDFGSYRYRKNKQFRGVKS